MWSLARRSLSTGQYKKYLTILDVKKNSTPKDIKDSFLRLSKIYHPDNKLTGSHTKFVELKEAYEALKDGNTPQDTSYSPPGQAPRPRPRPRPAEPVDMYHIYNVYKTLNRAEEPEVPKFRPYDEHFYPGTRYNRFEYSRFYDREAGAWVYMKKGTYVNYRRQMSEKSRILMICIAVLMLGSLAPVFKSSSSIFGPKPRPKEEERDDDNQKGRTVQEIEEFLSQSPDK